MTIAQRLDAVRDSHDVLRHPFYVRWSEGDLSREELAFYAGQYRHAVVALAEATAAAAAMADDDIRGELERHAEEERAHVRLWDDFAAGLEVSAPAPALDETAQCAGAWAAAPDLLTGLATLYAIEASQPAVSRTKVEGLVAHYGFVPGSPATAYFELHATRDEDHAREALAAVEQRADEGDADRLAAAAETALRGNWLLLDGVEAYAATSSRTTTFRTRPRRGSRPKAPGCR